MDLVPLESVDLSIHPLSPRAIPQNRTRYRSSPNPTNELPFELALEMKIKQLEATLQDTIRSKDSVIKDLRSELNEVCADLKGVRMDLKGIRMKLDDVGINCTCDAYRKAMEKREETEGRPTSADGIQTCSSTTNKKPVRSIPRWSGICSSDGKLGIYAPARGGLELLELKKGHTLRTLIPRVIEGINEIRAEFTPCNNYILYYHNGHKTLRIFRASDGQLISSFKPHAQLTSFVASKDAKTIVIGGVDGSVLVTALVDPQDPRSLHYLAKHPGRKALADHIGVENMETEETLRSFSNLRIVGKAVNKFKSLINQDQKPSAVCSIQ